MAFLQALKDLTQLSSQKKRTAQAQLQAATSAQRLSEKKLDKTVPSSPTVQQRSSVGSAMASPTYSTPRQNSGGNESLVRTLGGLAQGPSSVPSSIGATNRTITPQTPQDDSLARLRSAYVASLQPSTEEGEVSKRLADLESATQQGLVGMEGQGRGTVNTLVRGQQEKLQRQAELQALPLSARLAAIQSERQATQAAKGAELGFAQEDIQLAKQESAEKERSIFEIASNAAKGGATSDEINAILSSSSSSEALSKASPYLSTPQSISDVYGNGDIGEYNYAVSQGYTGSLLDYQKEKKATPAEEAGPSSYSQERAIRTVQSVDELLSEAEANKGIFGRTAALPVPESLRSDAYRNFISELDTLKSNIAFNELTQMREASKTGGALGQVSDKEAQLLQSALGALQMSQSPENFIAQLKKVRDSIERWQNAVGTTSTTGGEWTNW